MAALRLGMAFASETIIDYFNKVKPPYNVNEATQQLALAALDNMMWVNEHIRKTVALREELIRQLQLVSFVEKIYPSDANFILAKMKDITSSLHTPCQPWNYSPQPQQSATLRRLPAHYRWHCSRK